MKIQKWYFTFDRDHEFSGAYFEQEGTLFEVCKKMNDLFDDWEDYHEEEYFENLFIKPKLLRKLSPQEIVGRKRPRDDTTLERLTEEDAIELGKIALYGEKVYVKLRRHSISLFNSESYCYIFINEYGDMTIDTDNYGDSAVTINFSGMLDWFKSKRIVFLKQ